MRSLISIVAMGVNDKVGRNDTGANIIGSRRSRIVERDQVAVRRPQGVVQVHSQRRFKVRRVTLTRETGMQDGLVEERITHLSVDTRLVGRAELTIHERPYIDPNGGPAPGVEER